MQGSDIVAAARRYTGVKFRHQGRNRLGVDCLGLLICISEDLGLCWGDELQNKMKENNYSHFPDEHYLRQSIEMFLQPSTGKAMRHGEVALLKVAGRVQHLGVIATDKECTTLIHAYAPARKVVEHGMDKMWEKALVKRYGLGGDG